MDLRAVALIAAVVAFVAVASRSGAQAQDGAEIEFTVVDDLDFPIADATIQLNIPGGGRRRPQRTDQNGKTVFEGVSRGASLTYYAYHEGFQGIGSQTLSFAPGERSVAVRVVLTPRPDIAAMTATGVIEGRVVGPDDKPIAGAHVAWGTPWGAAEGGKADTGADGRYRLVAEKCAFAAPDGARLSVRADGFAPAVRADVKPAVGAEKPPQADFKLEPGHRIDGVVVDEHGAPVAGVQVRAEYRLAFDRFYPYYLGGEQLRPIVPETDANGRFSIADAPGTSITLSVSGRGWSYLTQHNVPLDREARLVLKPNGVIRGRVIEMETGRPVPVFVVKVQGPGLDLRRWEPGETLRTPDGAFTLADLSCDFDFRIAVEAPGLASVSLNGLRPESPAQQAGATTGVVVVELCKAQLLQGEVIDAETSQPLVDAQVTYASRGGTRSARADERGAFAFDDTETTGALLIQFPGYQSLVIQTQERERYADFGWLRIPLRRDSATTPGRLPGE